MQIGARFLEGNWAMYSKTTFGFPFWHSNYPYRNLPWRYSCDNEIRMYQVVRWSSTIAKYWEELKMPMSKEGCNNLPHIHMTQWDAPVMKEWRMSLYLWTDTEWLLGNIVKTKNKATKVSMVCSPLWKRKRGRGNTQKPVFLCKKKQKLTWLVAYSTQVQWDEMERRDAEVGVTFIRFSCCTVITFGTMLLLHMPPKLKLTKMGEPKGI
jgi:hypothetical protein